MLGVARLLFMMVWLFGFRLDAQRVPSGEAKSCVLGAIERAKQRAHDSLPVPERLSSPT